MNPRSLLLPSEPPNPSTNLLSSAKQEDEEPSTYQQAFENVPNFYNRKQPTQKSVYYDTATKTHLKIETTENEYKEY